MNVLVYTRNSAACFGTRMGLSGRHECDWLHMLRLRYGNCSKVIGNLEIVYMQTALAKEFKVA